MALTTAKGKSKFTTKIAYIITRILDPLALTPATIILIIIKFNQLYHPSTDIWLRLSLVLFIIAVLPITYFFTILKLKWVSDLDITNYRERYKFFLPLTACWILGLVLSFIFTRYHPLFETMTQLLVYLTGIAVGMTVITHFAEFKISGHSTGITAFSIFLQTYIIPNNYLIPIYIFLIILTGWSRVVLKKHRWIEVIAGIVLVAGLALIQVNLYPGL